MTFSDKELLNAKLQRAEAQLIINARDLESTAQQLNDQAKNYRELANLLSSVSLQVWQFDDKEEMF